jgi:prolipoprotein diacylglyceryl transferase
MYPTLQIGSVSLQISGLVLLAGLWLGLTLSERRIPRLGEDPSYLYNLVFISIIAGVIGARLSYIISYPEAFSTNLRNIISINPGLFDPFAGALFAFTAAVIYIYRKKLPVWSVLDDLTPLLAILAIAQGIANFAAGTAFGSPTDLPWGIYLWGTNRHPSQIYEIIFSALILVFLYFAYQSKINKISGSLFLIFVSLTAASRLFLDAFRGDSVLVGSGWRLTQVISWLVLAACLALLIKKFQRDEDKEISPH